MDAGEVRARLLGQFGVRIGPEMSHYVRRQLESAAVPGVTFPVMGEDARTGMPVRRIILGAALLGVPTAHPLTV